MTSAVDATQRRGWYHGWNIVAVCALSQAAANGLPINAFSLFLQDWSKQLNAPISTLQLALAALGVFSAIFSPFVGALADKYPARWLMGSGLVGIALFHLGVSLVTTSWQLLALFALLLPISVSFSTALPANAVVSRWFVRRLGLALGLTAFGLGVAGVILPPIVAILVPKFGWRTVWRVSGLIIAFVITPLVVWVVRERPGERDGLHYLTVGGQTAPYHGHGASSAAAGLSWRDVFARRNFWLLVAVYLPMLALYGGCGNNLAPIATSRGLTQQTAGVLLSAFSLSYVSATLIAGALSDRIGNRLTLFGLAMTTGLGGIIVALGHNEASLGVGVMLVGLSGGMFPLLAAASAAEFGASGVGRTFGLLMMFLPVIVLAPFLVAKARESTGSYVLGLIALAVLTLLGGAASLLMREPRATANV